jgi:hypothetical protein
MCFWCCAKRVHPGSPSGLSRALIILQKTYVMLRKMMITTTCPSPSGIDLSDSSSSLLAIDD